jgi:hypothetical protein
MQSLTRVPGFPFTWQSLGTAATKGLKKKVNETTIITLGNNLLTTTQTVLFANFLLRRAPTGSDIAGGYLICFCLPALTVKSGKEKGSIAHFLAGGQLRQQA